MEILFYRPMFTRFCFHPLLKSSNPNYFELVLLVEKWSKFGGMKATKKKVNRFLDSIRAKF